MLECFRKFSNTAHQFAVKVVRLKVIKICSQSDDLDLQSRSQLRLTFLTCSLTVTSRTPAKLWHSSLAWRHGMHVHARFDDLYFDARARRLGKGKQSDLNYLDNQASNRRVVELRNRVKISVSRDMSEIYLYLKCSILLIVSISKVDDDFVKRHDISVVKVVMRIVDVLCLKCHQWRYGLWRGADNSSW